MARLGAVERDLKLVTAGLEPAAIRLQLAAFARTERDRVVREQSGRAGAEPAVRTFVNGAEGRAEDQVVPPGPIVYLFDYAREIVAFALARAREESPVASGAYRDAWFVLADGAKAEPDEIPPGAEVYVVNDRPYARKIHVGGAQFSVPPGIVERVRQAVLKTYGNVVSAEIRFIPLQGGYVLKGRQRSVARKYAARIRARINAGGAASVDLNALEAVQNRRSAAFRAGRSTLTARKDTRAGQQMTYPALLIRPR